MSRLRFAVTDCLSNWLSLRKLLLNRLIRKKPLMMLDKINTDKPVLEPQLTELLPYLDKTILINETFYPQLVAELKKLNAKIIPINDSPQTPDELFALILDLGKQLGG